MVFDGFDNPTRDFTTSSEAGREVFAAANVALAKALEVEGRSLHLGSAQSQMPLGSAPAGGKNKVAR